MSEIWPWEFSLLHLKREVCLRIPEYAGVVWSGVVLLRRKPENSWSSKQVSRVPLYASAPIAYDGPVYATKMVTWLYLDLGISRTANCYGNLIANVGQNVPAGSTPTNTIGPRSHSRLSVRYVLVVLKWRKNRSIFIARLVFSFDIVQSDSFLCQPTDEHNHEAFACELTCLRLATIIVNVSVTFENLPAVWITY